MEQIIQENRKRWNELAENKTMHTVPFLNFTREDAERFKSIAHTNFGIV